MSNFESGSDVIVDNANAEEIPSIEFANAILFDALTTIRQDALVSMAARVSFDEQRNKAIYQLNGSVVSNHAEDQEDVPFPWMDGIITSDIERINNLKTSITAAITYFEQNADSITVVEDEEILEEDPE